MTTLKLVSSQLSSKKKTIAARLLIADSEVKDVDILVTGLNLGVECWMIQKESNVQEMLKKAICNIDLSILHLLGHGMPGVITLGNMKIDIANWSILTCDNSEVSQTQSKRTLSCQRNRSIFKKWTICFWSCNTGEGSKGRAFIQHVANCTGAAVYASSGLVGHSKCGGSWQLNEVAYPQNFSNALKI